jgi:predicted DNA-binding transcriptional regulator YafY
VKDEVLENIQHAVLHCRQVVVTYRNQGADAATEMPLHPLGLIQRGQITYLLATAYHYQDVRLFALHRMESVLLLDRPVVTPEGFDIDESLRQGLGQFGTGQTIRLVARIDPWLAQHLQETRLSEDQQLTELPDGNWLLDARVAETWQLEWWILSQGPALEVLEPVDLREHIHRTLKKAARQYKRPGPLTTPVEGGPTPDQA